MEKLPLLTDRAIEHPDEDGLAFQSYARIISQAVQDTEGPFTIGIFGDWGAGKTSLMNLIKTELVGSNKSSGNASGNTHNILPVWFNAWQFEKEDNPIIPLVGSIIAAFEQRPDFCDALGKDRKKTLKQGLQAALESLTLKADIKTPWGGLEAALPFKEFFDRLQYWNKGLYSRAYRELKDVRLLQGKKIVMFIDDLDRCLPDQAIKLLETVKLILAQPGFVFIIGLSYKVIMGYLRYLYKEKYGLAGFSSDKYLEKIVQLPFYIPPQRDEKVITGFITGLLARVPEEYREVLEQITEVIGPLHSNNPRAVVRYINNLMVWKNMADLQPDQGFSFGSLVVSSTLYERWPAVHDKLWGTVELSLYLAQLPAGQEELHTCIGELEKDPQGGQEVLEVARQLADDQELRLLLLSELGKRWLTHAEERKKSSDFTQALLVVTPDKLTFAVEVKKSKEAYGEGKTWYEFKVWLDVEDSLLNLVEAVTYHLHPTFHRPVREVSNRDTRFLMSEEFYGGFILRAAVKVRGQAEPVEKEISISPRETVPESAVTGGPGAGGSN